MSSTSIFLSVVIPVYRAERILPALCERLSSVLMTITERFEMILVDDRSPDGSWEVLSGLAGKYPELVAVRLSRNFGQPYATTAGMDLARGEWTVVMDCDLQDPPEEIPTLLRKAQEGFDVVVVRRIEKQHSFIKKCGSYLFWKVFGVLSGYRVDNSVGSFRIMRRAVVQAYCRCRENSRIFGGLIHWLGFTTASIDVKHAARFEGKSTYNIRRLLKMAVDGIVSFSNRPLYLSILVGAVISCLAGIYGVFYVARYLVYGIPQVHGWLSTVTLISFLGGLILMNQGILGLYIARIYDESKNRPMYVVDQIVCGTAVTRSPTDEFDLITG